MSPSAVLAQMWMTHHIRGLVQSDSAVVQLVQVGVAGLVDVAPGGRFNLENIKKYDSTVTIIQSIVN